MHKLYFVLGVLLFVSVMPFFAVAEEDASSNQESLLQTSTMPSVLSGGEQVFEYFILRNNSQIGTYRFAVTPLNHQSQSKNEEPKPRFKIETHMQVKVKILFVTAHSSNYHATSVYEGEKLVRHEGLGEFNDKSYIVNFDASENPDHFIVNASGKKILYTPVTLHPLYLNVDEPNENKQNFMSLITEKGKQRKITHKTIGKERQKINSKDFQTIHTQIMGEINRQLWYDLQGILLKVSYKKDGAQIILLRKDI